VDSEIGRIMETLKSRGLDKNTVVIFTSDNGPWLNFGNHAGNAGGFREGKAGMVCLRLEYCIGYFQECIKQNCIPKN
jgi:hypothetical protein